MAETAGIVRDGGDRADGRSARKREPGVRRCAVTRAKRPQAELLRFVVDPNGVVAPDVACRLPGRGVWVTPDLAILTKAAKAGRFQSGFKADVQVPADLIDATRALLERRLAELLGLARGAGHVAAGWEQARDFARRYPVGLVVVAADAAAPSRRRLEGLAQGAPVMDMLDAAALGRALGRERVVNALVRQGRFADMLAQEAARRRGLDSAQDDGARNIRAAATTPGGEG